MGGRYFFIVFLIFLVACESTLQAVHTSEYQAPVEEVKTAEPQIDSCENVTCSGGQFCKEGSCECETGKLCNDVCIDSAACCENSDCDEGSCDNGACTAKQCRFGEELKNGECRCANNGVYCKEQGKCIKRDDCCIHSQCDRFERCVPTNWRASLCMKQDEKKLCKLLADNNRTETFDIKGNTFKITAKDWLSDESVTFSINNETVRLATNKTMEYGNITLFQEGITITGGFCKEDEED